jgi:hypothetical protein
MALSLQIQKWVKEKQPPALKSADGFWERYVSFLLRGRSFGGGNGGRRSRSISRFGLLGGRRSGSSGSGGLFFAGREAESDCREKNAREECFH